MTIRHWILLSVFFAGCERVVLYRRDADASDAADATAPIDVTHADAVADLTNERPPDAIDAAPTILAPRPIAPLSAMQLVANRPTLRWRLAPDSDGAELEVCSTRDCATVEARASVRGESHTLESALRPGVHFWRLRGRRGAATGGAYSPVWQFWAGARSTSEQTAWGPLPDFNGDGLLDFAVGDENTSRNRVFVFFGERTGVPLSPSVELSPGDTNFGFETASVGDINGDGFADLAVGAPNFHGTPGFNGSVRVFFGDASGFADTSGQPITGAIFGGGFGTAITSLGDFDGDGYGDVATASIGRGAGGTVEIFRGGPTGLDPVPAQLISTTNVSSEFGHDLASADLDRDGVNDLLIGAPRAASNVGRAFLVMGSSAGYTAAPRELVAQPMSGVVTEPGQPGPQYGRSLRVVGDVDGDGFMEFVVNAPYDESGSVAVYRGAATVDRAQRPQPALVLRGDGRTTGSLFGFSMAALGDIDGDGLDDVAIGAPGDRADADPIAGRLLIYRGSSATLLDGAPAVLVGEAGRIGLGETVTVADVDGAPPFDVVGGGAGNNLNGSVDLFSLSAGGFRRVGGRTDTLGGWFSKRGLSER